MILIPATLGDYWVLTFGTVGAIALAVIGLNVAMGWAGLLSFGQPVFMAVGGYASAILTTRYGVNPWLALACGIVLSAVLAAVIGSPCSSWKATGATNPYVLASTENNTDTVVYQPAGAAS